MKKVKGTYGGNPPYIKEKLPSDFLPTEDPSPVGSVCVGSTGDGIHIFRRLPSDKDELFFAE